MRCEGCPFFETIEPSGKQENEKVLQEGRDGLGKNSDLRVGCLVDCWMAVGGLVRRCERGKLFFKTSNKRQARKRWLLDKTRQS